MIIRKLTELKKLENNPRKIKIEDMEKLKKSIKKFGLLKARPLILSNRTGELVIIGGNMRYEACKSLGIEEVPTELIEGLTEEDEKEIMIRDNVSNGEWDFDILNSDFDLSNIQDWGVNIPNFDDIDFDNIEGNENRTENTKKAQNVICPNCNHSFTI